jgi:hypothetical protein
VDPNAPRDTAAAGRGLAGLPLPGAGERHGIANGHVLAAIVDHLLLVPVAGPREWTWEQRSAPGGEVRAESLTRATAAASLP